MTGLTDPTDPHELRRQFPDLADFTDTLVPLSAVLDAIQDGRLLLACYRNRPNDLAVPAGRRVIDTATEVGDEAIEAIVMSLATRTDEAAFTDEAA